MSKKQPRYALLKHKNAELIIDLVGAQIVAYQIDGLDIIYQGAIDPTSQWKGSAKNLFPNPGPIAQKGSENEVVEGLESFKINEEEVIKSGKYTKYTHNGGVYYMKQHGFVQDKLFAVQGKGKDYCMLTFRSGGQPNDEADYSSYLQYPYAFKYDVLQSLTNNGLEYQSSVTNVDNKPMLAGMGWHPAFLLHAPRSRYYVVFKNLKTKIYNKEESTLVPEENVAYPVKDIINNGKASTFGGIESADVEIVYNSPTHGKITYLTMHTEEPYFLLWSRAKENKNQQDFICLEPWNTAPRQISKLTTQDKTESLAQSGSVIVQPNETKTLKVDVKVNEEYIKALSLEKIKTFSENNGLTL